MSLQAAANTLYDWAVGLTPNRAQLLAGARALDAMATEDDRALLNAAAGLRELAASGAPDLGPTERKRAAILAAYLHRIADPQATT